jgi:hypothetical protein
MIQFLINFHGIYFTIFIIYMPTFQPKTIRKCRFIELNHRVIEFTAMEDPSD